MSEAVVSLVTPEHLAGLPRFDAKSAMAAAKRLLEFHGMIGNGDSRHDAGWTAMFARQLEYRYTQTFDAIYPKFKARQLIPVDNQVPTGAEFFTYRQFNTAGSLGQIVHNYADDAPQADIMGEEFAQRIVSVTSAYSYSIQDMRAAAMAGVPLEAKKAENAREMIERKLEDLAALGSLAVKQPNGTAFYGLLNAPGVAATIQVSTGTWAAQYAADTSQDKTTSKAAIANDINAMRQTVFNATKGEAGDIGTMTLIVSTPVYSFLATTARSILYDNTGSSLLTWLKDACGLVSIEFWNRVDTAGAGGHGRMMLYPKDPRVVSLIISQEFEQFAPQPRNLGFLVNCHFRTGAVEVRYPLHLTYMDGPSP